MPNPFRDSLARYGQANQPTAPAQTGQSGYNPYSAGDKRYGPSASQGPNTGMNLDKSGYEDRDRRAAIRKQLMLRRLKAGQAGRYLSSDYMNPNS